MDFHFSKIDLPEEMANVHVSIDSDTHSIKFEVDLDSLPGLE